MVYGKGNKSFGIRVDIIPLAISGMVRKIACSAYTQMENWSLNVGIGPVQNIKPNVITTQEQTNFFPKCDTERLMILQCILNTIPDSALKKRNGTRTNTWTASRPIILMEKFN